MSTLHQLCNNQTNISKRNYCQNRYPNLITKLYIYTKRKTKIGLLKGNTTPKAILFQTKLPSSKSPKGYHWRVIRKRLFSLSEEKFFEYKNYWCIFLTLFQSHFTYVFLSSRSKMKHKSPSLMVLDQNSGISSSVDRSKVENPLLFSRFLRKSKNMLDTSL